MADDRPRTRALPHQPLRLADILLENEELREQERRFRVTTDRLQQERDEESASADYYRERLRDEKADKENAVASADRGKEDAREQRDRALEKEKMTALRLEALRAASRAVLVAAERSNGVVTGELGTALAEMARVEEEMGR